jgi:hypothetical protein
LNIKNKKKKREREDLGDYVRIIDTTRKPDANNSTNPHSSATRSITSSSLAVQVTNNSIFNPEDFTQKNEKKVRELLYTALHGRNV